MNGKTFFFRFPSCLLGISAHRWPSPRTRHAAFACLPQRPAGFLRPWMTTSFAAATAFSKSSRGTEGLLPLFLDTQYHATILPTFLQGHLLSLALQTTPSGRHEMVLFFSFVSKSWKMLLPPLVEYFRMCHLSIIYVLFCSPSAAALTPSQFCATNTKRKSNLPDFPKSCLVLVRLSLFLFDISFSSSLLFAVRKLAILPLHFFHQLLLLYFTFFFLSFCFFFFFHFFPFRFF